MKESAVRTSPEPPASDLGGRVSEAARPIDVLRIADIHLDQVTKVFDEVVAVDDLSLTVSPGEFFSLLGPSGCGKTTTLRMIGGFENPTLGIVYLGGKDVTDVPPYRRDVNTVFQSYALFPHRNVEENLEFGLRQRKVPKDETRRRVQEALALVDLSEMEKRKPSQLSGGQQQRVALARALINRPRVLLLDEPLGALDARLRKQMQLELKRIQSEVGITFIYVTHDQEEALTMSDRIAVMNKGQIEQIGAPQEVYERPATEFVADFLGASNLLPAVLESCRQGRATAVLQDGTRVSVPDSGHETGTKVAVGVRPEKILMALEGTEVSPNDGDSSWNSVTGTVRMATFVGVSYQYTIQGPGGRILTVFAQNQGTAPLARQGEQVQLLWRPEHSFVVEPR